MTAGLENPDIIIGIGQILGIITSVVTIVIVYVIERKALIGWRKILWSALLLLWIGIILIILALILLFTFEYSNLLSISGIFFWILGILLFMGIFYQMCFLETIPFSKPDDIYFDELESRFKADCIDSAIEQAKKEKKKFHFPVILAADEGWQPWIIGLDLANDAFEQEAGVVYFTFTRPASMIFKQLHIKSKQNKGTIGANLIIIDCFTPIEKPVRIFLLYRKCIKYIFSAFQFKNKTDDLEKCILSADPRNPDELNEKYDRALEHLSKNKTDDLEKGMLFADPRNPHELNKKYNRALEHLHKNKKIKKLVVIYDSLSEFLLFSDMELAIQYLRHNMVWEEKNNVNSLYIVRLNTLEKSLEEYILWFADVVIYFKTENQMPLMRIRGLFKGPRNYAIEYNYKFIF